MPFDIPAAIESVSSTVGKVVERIWPDPTEAERMKLERFTSELGAQMNVIMAEAKSDSWITRSWRPIMMLTFVGIVANNYIIAPYAFTLFGASVYLEIPPDMWGLLKLGLGGYVGGRTIEKIAPTVKDAVKSWKNPDK